MIIEAREDVVTLRGKLARNQWQNIKAAANHLLHNHPQGIIIDCGHIDLATQEGIETFVDARLDIEAQGARIMLCNVPQEILDAMRSVPGASSQLPVARGAEEARASLRLMRGKGLPSAVGEMTLLVPLLGPGDAEIGVPLACQVAPRERALIHMIYVVTVPRALPLGTPLAEHAALAEAELAQGEAITRGRNLPCRRYIEQTRSVSEAILAAARTLPAHKIVLGLRCVEEEEEEEALHETVMALLRQAPCEVIVSRAAKGGGRG